MKGEAEKPKPKPKAAKVPDASAVAPTQQPATVAKLKIGDAEMTADEIAQRIADLEAKAKAKEVEKVEPPKTETPEERAQAKQQEATDLQAKDDEFITASAANYMPTQDEFDTMLASGNPELLAKMFARCELNARKWMAEQVNPSLAKMNERMEPVFKDREEIAQFQTQNQFLTSNPDIKGHAKGVETMQAVQRDLKAAHSRLERLKNANVATPEEIATLKRFDEVTPDEWSADVAHHTRARLGLTAAAPAATPQAPPASPTPKPQPKAEQPLNEGAARPGGAAPGKQRNEESETAGAVFARM